MTREDIAENKEPQTPPGIRPTKFTIPQEEPFVPLPPSHTDHKPEKIKRIPGGIDERKLSYPSAAQALPTGDRD